MSRKNLSLKGNCPNGCSLLKHLSLVALSKGQGFLLFEKDRKMRDAANSAFSRSDLYRAMYLASLGHGSRLESFFPGMITNYTEAPPS